MFTCAHAFDQQNVHNLIPCKWVVGGNGGEGGGREWRMTINSDKIIDENCKIPLYTNFKNTQAKTGVY